MKQVIAIAILATALLDVSTSYAWVCTYVGPLGAVYSRDGGGFGRLAAKRNALEACRINKARGVGPCVFRGCR